MQQFPPPLACGDGRLRTSLGHRQNKDEIGFICMVRWKLISKHSFTDKTILSQFFHVIVVTVHNATYTAPTINSVDPRSWNSLFTLLFSLCANPHPNHTPTSLLHLPRLSSSPPKLFSSLFLTSWNSLFHCPFSGRWCLGWLGQPLAWSIVADNKHVQKLTQSVE